MINKISQKVARPVEQQVVKTSEKVAPKFSKTDLQTLSGIYFNPFALIERPIPRTQDLGNILNFFG